MFHRVKKQLATSQGNFTTLSPHILWLTSLKVIYFVASAHSGR